MTTFLIFFALLFILIISHECGHFFSARAFGIRVDEFGFGLPPRIFGVRMGKTLYSLNWLPFGGFVRIYGEDGDDVDTPDNFCRKSALARSLVLISGVLANVLLAYIILSFLVTRGIIVEPLSEEKAINIPDARMTIVEIAPSSPAFVAGLRTSDAVRQIGAAQKDMFAPRTIEEFQKYVKKHAGETLSLLIERDRTEILLTLTPRVSPPTGEGPIGIALSWAHAKRVSWYQAPIAGAALTYQTIIYTADGFITIVRDVFRGRGQDVPVAGPVGIFHIVGEAQQSGLSMIFLLTAVLSINLALINILPIPGLDGGRLMFTLAESITRRRISPRVNAVVHGAGLALLLTLMIVVTYIDFARIF